MAVGRPENQDKTRPDRKGLWLLPLLALGVGTLIITRKKLSPPYQPTKAEASQAAKREAFRQAKYLVGNQVIQDHPKSVIMLGFTPGAADSVTELGRNRFRCSGFLAGRSRAGIPLRERWQCIITGSQTSWLCESFRQSGWKPFLSSPVRRGR